MNPQCPGLDLECRTIAEPSIIDAGGAQWQRHRHRLVECDIDIFRLFAGIADKGPVAPAGPGAKQEISWARCERHSDRNDGASTRLRSLEPIVQSERAFDNDRVQRFTEIAEIEMTATGCVETLQLPPCCRLITQRLNDAPDNSQYDAEDASVALLRLSRDRSICSYVD